MTLLLSQVMFEALYQKRQRRINVSASAELLAFQAPVHSHHMA